MLLGKTQGIKLFGRWTWHSVGETLMEYDFFSRFKIKNWAQHISGRLHFQNTHDTAVRVRFAFQNRKRMNGRELFWRIEVGKFLTSVIHCCFGSLVRCFLGSLRQCIVHHWVIDSVIRCFIDSFTHCLTESFSHCFIDFFGRRFADSLARWFNGSLIH